MPFALVAAVALGLALVPALGLSKAAAPVATAAIASFVALAVGCLVTSGLAQCGMARLAGKLERVTAGERELTIRPSGIGAERRMSRAIGQVSESLEAARSAATTDRLTGVLNRPALFAELLRAVEEANRYDLPLAVAFVDIDRFKAVNDTHGHQAGDAVLRQLAQMLRANIRASDAVGRYGGEEFLVVLTSTGPDEAAQKAETLRQLVQRCRFRLKSAQSRAPVELELTVSIGIAGGSGHPHHLDELIRHADEAMYSAKALGRNRTCVYAEEDDDIQIARAIVSLEGRGRATEVGRLATSAAERALTAVAEPYGRCGGAAAPSIALIAVRMARRLGLPRNEIERIRIAALLRDIGKVALPRSILEKPGALSEAEFRIVAQHPRIGQLILEQSSVLAEAAPIVLHHHERFAGLGYPYGLRGEQIPIGARIVAIAEAYDAMTHDRPYRTAMSHDEAIRELRRMAGTHFDPELVSVFCELHAEAGRAEDAWPALIAELSGRRGRHAGGRSEDRSSTSPRSA
jgi:diguanylate cyclase (GGDEF)-like protein